MELCNDLLAFNQFLDLGLDVGEQFARLLWGEQVELLILEGRGLIRLRHPFFST
jgi:hypothetical protein